MGVICGSKTMNSFKTMTIVRYKPQDTLIFLRYSSRIYDAIVAETLEKDTDAL